MKASKKVTAIFLVLLVLYWLPFGVILVQGQGSTVASVDQLEKSDAVIVFGTLVNSVGDISPLLKERLDAGKAVLESAKADRVVVSNTAAAAKVMVGYLTAAGVDKNLIDIDPEAVKTPDTCSFEKRNHPKGRRLIFVSQGFHLPRLLYQCRMLGVEGIGFPADAASNIDRSKYSLWTKLRVRSTRYVREAGLTWLAFLRIYSHP